MSGRPFSAPARGAAAFLGCFFAAFAAVASLVASSAAPETSELMPLADRSLLLDVAAAGPRLVAVGDRGHVLLSDDQGASWRQVVVPTRAMLTGVTFADDRHGWAVGHDGVILATTDAGATWTRQDPGNDLESVWLDVGYDPAGAVIAVGAYGKFALSRDGGKAWTSSQPSGDESHYNQLTITPAGELILSGETGLLLRSRDHGATWQRGELPYDGSLFGTLALGDGRYLAYGLRGHVFAGDDAFKWTERESPTPALLLAGLRLRNGTLVLAGQGGNFFVSRDAGRSFTLWKPTEYNGSVAALLETTDGRLLVAGELGLARLAVPEGSTP